MNLIQWLNRIFNSDSYSTINNLFGSSGTNSLYGTGFNPSSYGGETFGKGLSDKFLGTNFLSQDAATTAFDRQKELQDRDFAFQQQMWQQSNQYNSPEAQMQRFRDAGLNPNLVTGSAPVPAQPMSGSSASAPMATGANGAGDLINYLKNLAILPAEIDLMKSEAERNRAAANYQNEMLDIEHERNDISWETARQGAQRVEAYCNDIENIIEYRGKDFDLNQQIFIWKKKVDEEHIKQAWQQLGLTEETVRMQAAMLPFMKAEIRARCAELYAQAKELKQRANLEHNQADKVNIEKELEDINLEYQRVLQSARRGFEDKIKEGEWADIQRIIDENKSASAVAIRQKSINESDFDFWTYSLLTHGSTLNPNFVVNQSNKAKNVLNQKNRTKIGFKK